MGLMLFSFYILPLSFKNIKFLSIAVGTQLYVLLKCGGSSSLYFSEVMTNYTLLNSPSFELSTFTLAFLLNSPSFIEQ